MVSKKSSIVVKLRGGVGFVDMQVLQRRLQEDLIMNIGGLKAPTSSAPASAKKVYGSQEKVWKGWGEEVL